MQLKDNKELNKSEEQLRLVFEHANEVIVIAQDEKVKFCNPQITELTGYSLDEVYSMSFFDFIHPEDLKMVLREYQDRLSGEKTKNRYSVRIITKDDQEKSIIVSSKFMNWDGEPATIAMLTDITELKDTEKRLLRSEEHFRNLIEQSPLAMVILSPEGKITEVNSAWYRQWDLNREDAIEFFARYNQRTDKQLEDLGVMPLIERAYAGEGLILPPIEYIANRTLDELKLEDVEAGSRWIQIHLYPIKDENGSVTSVVNTNVDITELKRAEQEAQQQREVLARIDRASHMGQLTGSIAHEINQPLTGILSNAQAVELMLRSDASNTDEVLMVIGDIIADTRRAGDVIRNLRELYREQKNESEAIDINSIAEETLQLLHSELVKYNVIVKKETAKSLPKIQGNKVLIQQVIVNLLINAIEAMNGVDKDKHHITITIKFHKKEVSVDIDDVGTGIDKDKIGRIFQPLVTWKSGGTGMGLAISNSIIESHGGTMHAKNLPGGGTRVGFNLPIIDKK